MPPDIQRFVITCIPEGRLRLIDLLTQQWPQQSASFWRDQIDRQKVWINDQPARLANHLLEVGNCILYAPLEAAPWQLSDQNEDFWVLNKPFACTVFEAKPYLATLSSHEAHFVHRLDKMTTGALVVAKSKLAQSQLESIFRQHAVQKDYLAVVWGKPSQLSGMIDARLVKTASPHGGARVQAAREDARGHSLSAQTSWRLLAHYDGLSVLLCRPLSGRTHQIRAHLHHLGLPIVGDRDYQIDTKTRRWQGNLFFAQHLLHAYGIRMTWKGRVRYFNALLSLEFERALAQISPRLLEHCTALKPIDEFS